MRLYPMLNTRRARAMGDDRGGDEVVLTAALLLILPTVDMIWKRSNDAAEQYCRFSLEIILLGPG